MARRGLTKAPCGAGAAMRSLRKHRRLDVNQTAPEIGLGERTYQRREAAETVQVGELLALAKALKGDAAALLLCAMGLPPALAALCADNKAASIAADMLAELAEQLGEDFARLTSAAFLEAFDMARRRLLAQAGSEAGPVPTAASPLSERQLECLRWASLGKSSSDIGAILGLSPHTVDDYLKEACALLGVRTRIQAILRGLAEGWLTP